MYNVPRKRNPPPLREVYKFFAYHFSKHGWMVFWAFFLIFLSALTNIAMPPVHGWLVDVLSENVSGTRDFGALLEPVIALTVLSALYHLTMRGAHFLNSCAAGGIVGPVDHVVRIGNPIVEFLCRFGSTRKASS